MSDPDIANRTPFSRLSFWEKCKTILFLSVFAAGAAAVLSLIVMIIWLNLQPCVCTGSRSEDPECCYIH